MFNSSDNPFLDSCKVEKLRLLAKENLSGSENKAFSFGNLGFSGSEGCGLPVFDRSEGRGLVINAISRRDCERSEILPEFYDVFLIPDSRVLGIKPIREVKKKAKNTKPRGVIKGFSRKSRSRMLYKLGSLTRDCEKPVFVTLTYPDEFPDLERSKKQLQAFLKRLVRAFPQVGYIWKLEIKARKTGINQGQLAPHFHLFIWGIPFAVLHFNVRKWWFEVVGSGDYKHFRAGSRVEKIRRWKGILSYSSKYMSKIDEDSGATIGRVWGYGGEIPMGKEIHYKMGLKDILPFYRGLLHYIKKSDWSNGRNKSMWILCEDPARWCSVYFERHTQ